MKAPFGASAKLEFDLFSLLFVKNEWFCCFFILLSPLRFPNLITIVFLIEISVRIASYEKPLDLFKSGWNIFDFVIVTMSLIPIDGNHAAVARLLRIFRILRLITIIPELKELVEQNRALIEKVERLEGMIEEKGKTS